MPFDFSKPMFFGLEDMPGKAKKSGAFASGLGNLSLTVDPAIKYKNMPFYCNNDFSKSVTCCFNHMVGLPVKNDQPHPIHDYETNIYNDLEQGLKYLAIKKARGIGISEFFLRYMAWLGVCRNQAYKKSRFFIVCGPGATTAMDLIKRLKLILAPLGILEETAATECEFLNVTIEAKPGSHVSTLRGYTDIKFILIDEASFWIGEKEADEIRSVAEGYIAKTHPVIAMVSTPSVPGTMFEKIMEEPDDTCLYKKYRLPYTVGLGKIYTEEEIALARLSPHFEREYNLKYGIGMGNLFDDKDIDALMIDDTELEAQKHMWNQPPHHIAIGCDPGFGSSLASYVICAQIGDKVVVLDSGAFERESFRWFSNVIFDKFHEYHADKIFVDGSAADVVTDLKQAFREDTNYQAVQKRAHREYQYDKDAWMTRMIIVPIQFNQYGDSMIHNLVYIVQNQLILIPKKMEALILDMRMAREKNGKLDKTGINGMDLLDALRLACLMYQYK
jgi:hypothetical protein